MINKRLFDHYGINIDKDLKISHRCSRPFDTVLIDKNGSCYACECQSWLPQSIGNLQIRSLSEILESPELQHLQSSIEDGSYRYCNQARCSYLRHGFPDERKTEMKLRLAIDDSCNLRCPTCRKSLIFRKSGSTFDKGIRLADKINDWLASHEEPVQIHIGSDGDPFASKIYAHFMEHTPKRKNIRYSLLTNGSLFGDDYHKIPHVIGNLNELGISIDGACRETYEKLRLGGRWDKIINSLEQVARLRETQDFVLTIQFVVQRDNYHEMQDIIDLGTKYKADRVLLNKIEDWNVMQDWRQHNIFDSEHPLHEDFREKLEKISHFFTRDRNIRPLVKAPTFFYSDKGKERVILT